MQGRKPIDLVSILESLYDVEQPLDAWAKAAMVSLQSSLHVDIGVGITVYELGDSPQVSVRYFDDIGFPAGFAEIRRQQQLDPALQAEYRHGYEHVQVADVTSRIESPERAAYYASTRIRGVAALNACDPSLHGFAFYLCMSEPIRFSRKCWETLRRISAHMSTSYRLHRRLHDSRATPAAIFGAHGRLEHVERGALHDDTVSALTTAVASQRWARAPVGRNDPAAAIVAWKGMVDGQWTLMDHIDRTGRRFTHAIENAPRDRLGQPLSEREAQVVALAQMGRHNKLIAYELGISHATVRVLLARAARKLGVRDRQSLMTSDAGKARTSLVASVRG